MNKRMNNRVSLQGEIEEAFVFDHEAYGEKFYSSKLAVARQSGTLDHIPLMVSEYFLNEWDRAKRYVLINGEFRSRNDHSRKANKLQLYVFAQEVDLLRENKNENDVWLDGYIVKPPTHRKTPLGREITDLLVAVHRPYGKSDYIPCICWGNNALYSFGFEVGDHIALTGRLQSREYQKVLPDGQQETRVAYEVSVSRIKKEV